MKNKLLKLLKESLAGSNPDSMMDGEKIRKILYESRQYFQNLRGRLASEDGQEREEALASAQELQQFLETQAQFFTLPTEFEPTQEQQAMIDEIQESFNNN